MQVVAAAERFRELRDVSTFCIRPARGSSSMMPCM